VSGSKYTSDALEDALRAVLGDLRACDTATPLIVTSYNATRSSSKFFKSWNSDTRLVDVCLASSAAPTFFEPHEIGGELFIDGGVHSNNPAICAYVDAITVFEGDDIRVLSIGGGPEDYVHVSKGWGLINWAKAIIPVFMNSADSTTVYQMQQLLGDKFLRINPSHRCALDDVSRSNLVAMVEEGERLWEENREAVLKMLQ
jgi:patatin-like phospholipase/acyl hydrolase